MPSAAIDKLKQDSRDLLLLHRRRIDEYFETRAFEPPREEIQHTYQNHLATIMATAADFVTLFDFLYVLVAQVVGVSLAPFGFPCLVVSGFPTSGDVVDVVHFSALWFNGIHGLCFIDMVFISPPVNKTFINNSRGFL